VPCSYERDEEDDLNEWDESDVPEHERRYFSVTLDGWATEDVLERLQAGSAEILTFSVWDQADPSEPYAPYSLIAKVEVTAYHGIKVIEPTEKPEEG
jgi:hypothetical protein